MGNEFPEGLLEGAFAAGNGAAVLLQQQQQQQQQGGTSSSSSSSSRNGDGRDNGVGGSRRPPLLTAVRPLQPLVPQVCVSVCVCVYVRYSHLWSVYVGGTLGEQNQAKAGSAQVCRGVGMHVCV